MKVRESGMPNEKIWTEFFEPEKILCIMELNHNVADVVEFGCGYGTFTLPAAKIVKGTVYAIDVEEEMIKRVVERANEKKLNNIRTLLRDFVNEGSGFEDRSVDYAMFFNILHAEKPEELLKEAYRILKSGGKLGVIHWNYDPETPRGPPMTIRPRPEQCIKWAIEGGFKFEGRHDLKPYHYGLVFSKPGKE
ncbi:methyltransferase domain-containing protein [Methanosarcina sp. DH2]|jgi:ubiquinone/menaquinone biosynthesis C-methylase UbiE|uniref:class I SAM-dependent methyltransferase n=1 Tax=Methanosarcina sp. DH2 TaxID=2605639 RepID=UPI001E4B2EC8|nr:class I SAM-dependent methyltransferase [Methanosarcina sp. DH2]MCC4771317.1 methyltransferase domain-containing protein [Methanosarcina sp. DH2]